MKKIVVFLLLFSSLIAHSQNVMKPFRFYVSPSIHIGFFSPDNVNNYIENALSSYELNFGTTDLIMNFNVGLGFGFRFSNLVELQTVTEYAFSPKTILVSNGENMSFTFSRFSAGLMANFMIPLSSNERKSSFILGGGMIYHNMSFEEYSANKLAPRFQAGFSINNNRFNPQILLSADIAKAYDGNFELDFSGVRIGVNLNL
jgi:hypothetical protein